MAKSKRMQAFREKIESRKQREEARHECEWIYENLKELSNYVEVGEATWLRERALHSIRHLVTFAKEINPSFELPWYCYCT